MTGSHFHALFDGPPRPPESPIEQRHMDLAASIQQVTEEVILRMAQHVYDQTRMKHLVLAGGVALNCVANGRVLRDGPFDDLWIQPAAGDAGGALGAALFTWYQLLEQPRDVSGHDRQHGSLLGPTFTSEQVADFLAERGHAIRRWADASELLEHVVEQLEAGRIVGWFQDRMEFGPRALGARSILGDPRSPRTQATMNLKIKFRESFRPFAPAVLREHAHEWYGIVRDEPGLATGFGVAAAVIGPLGLIAPSAIRPIFVAWMIIAFPIGWTVSRVLLALIYYGLFTPLALAFRLVGRDRLGRRHRPRLDTYWSSKSQPTGMHSYFRQF